MTTTLAVPTPVLPELHPAVSRSLSFASSWGLSRSTLFRTYAESQQALATMAEQADRFLGRVVQTNMQVSAQHFFTPPVPKAFHAELAVQSRAAVKKALGDALAEAAELFARHLIGALQELVRQNQVGLIEWFSPTVCRFSYFTATFSDQLVRREVDGGQVIEVMERTHRHLRHVHDVIDARLYPLPAEQVQQPSHVRRLIAEMPAFLRPFARVVAGNEIAVSTTETNRATELVTRVQPVFRVDPALVLGPFVLIGW